jgi:hypothetical protein
MPACASSFAHSGTQFTCFAGLKKRVACSSWVALLAADMRGACQQLAASRTHSEHVAQLACLLGVDMLRELTLSMSQLASC